MSVTCVCESGKSREAVRYERTPFVHYYRWTIRPLMHPTRALAIDLGKRFAKDAGCPQVLHREKRFSVRIMFREYFGFSPVQILDTAIHAWINGVS